MPSMVIGLITALVFAGVLLAGSFLYWSFQARRESRAQSLSRRLGTLARDPDAPDIFQLKEPDALADALGFVGRHLEDLVRQADAHHSIRGLVARIGIAALAGVVALSTALGPRGLVLGLFAGVIPYLVLQSRARARRVAISEQLPDALDLIGRSLQAGHGIADAFRLCAEESPMPIAREVGEVYEQHNLGRDFRECMTDLAGRNPHNFDLKIFVSSVLLQRETGGNLIEILDNIAATIRARFVFRAKVKALTAEARMSAVILGLLPFVVSGAILILRPNYLTVLVSDDLGRNMLMICGVLYLGGAVMMRSLAQVEA